MAGPTEAQLLQSHGAATSRLPARQVASLGWSHPRIGPGPRLDTRKVSGPDDKCRELVPRHSDSEYWQLAMPDTLRIYHVARFELAEALRSRLVLVLLFVYGGGALLGGRVFLALLSTAEQTARQALAGSMNVDPATLPDNLVREKAMPWLVGFVQDEGTREQLLQMDPLSIFFGYAALQSVAVLVLLLGTSSIAKDISTGAIRFLLFRCDRLSWTLGKLVGQALLLAGCLAVAAICTALVGTWYDESVDFGRWLWLMRTSFRAWVYGLSYLGIFCGVSMLATNPMRARGTALLLWLLMWIGHGLLTAQWAGGDYAWMTYAAWLFPTHHQDGLWSGNLLVYAGSVLGLLAIGAVGFSVGYSQFERRDA